MKKNMLKIAATIFATSIISGVLSACSLEDTMTYLMLKNKMGEWGDDYYYEGDDWDYEYDWDDESSDGDNNRRTNSNNGNSTNNNGSKDYKEEGFSYVYTVGSGECGVYAVNNGLKGISDIEVPKTYTDKQGNVYQVKYDCNNGFNALEDAKTITFQDGFEKVAVGFGSCMKLEKVVLPSTLKKISCCMLVNCLSFKTIEFKGTMSQWNNVEKLEEWNYMAPSFTVKCSDGNIPVEALQDD